MRYADADARKPDLNQFLARFALPERQPAVARALREGDQDDEEEEDSERGEETDEGRDPEGDGEIDGDPDGDNDEDEEGGGPRSRAERFKERGMRKASTVAAVPHHVLVTLRNCNAAERASERWGQAAAVSNPRSSAHVAGSNQWHFVRPLADRFGGNICNILAGDGRSRGRFGRRVEHGSHR